MIDAFKRTKDKVAIVGFAPGTRNMAPYNDPDYEVWGVNEEYNFDWLKRYDRWFQLHPRWDFSRENNTNDPNHFLWLQNKSGACIKCKGTGIFKTLDGKEEPCTICKAGIYTPSNRQIIPIYMQKAHSDIPGSITYPLKEVVDSFMADLKPTGRQLYFTSSPAYMLSLAVYLGFPRIELYGFEMGAMTEYHYQRSNFEYLIGKAQGMGFDVYIPKESSLLKGKLYGYENMKMGYRQNLEMRKVFLEGKMPEKKAAMHQKEGMVMVLKQLLDSPEITRDSVLKLIEEKKIEHKKAQGLVNFQNGAILEVDNMTKLYDGYFRADIEEADAENTYDDINTHVTVDYA